MLQKNQLKSKEYTIAKILTVALSILDLFTELNMADERATDRDVET